MNILSFTSDQAQFLQRMAAARPGFWEYECRVQILDSHSDGTLTVTRESLEAIRQELKLGMLNLPPQRSLSQYYTVNPPRMVWHDGHETGQLRLHPLEFAGSDPLAWLTAAYENAEELIAITENLINACLQAASYPEHVVPFEVDPPRRVHDPREIVLKSAAGFFHDMTAEEVLRVFDARNGTLAMREEIKWKNSLIVEAIRMGLNLQPRVLRHVHVEHAGTETEPWLTDADPPQNRFGTHVSSARTKGFHEFEGLEHQATELTRALRGIVSQ